MIDVKNLDNCSGCGACENICPKSAIKLISDDEGFLYPQIDENKCIDCGLCDSVCQIDNCANHQDDFDQKFYALINKNQNHLEVSSSGGAFLAIASYVFENGGVVFGCAFDKELKAHHIITHNIEECIDKLCGSKYVQSEIGYIYKEVKKQLAASRLVLFTGTPCQIEGLYLYLKNIPENLITIDLICHGVSSPLLWKKHKEHLENKHKAKITSFRFRGKQNAGWALYYYYCVTNKYKKGPSILDRYYTDFLKGENYRQSCYNCKYATLNRMGDLTIGDFWGVQNYFPNLDIHKGVSAVCVNTKKGEGVLSAVKERVCLYETEQENVVAHNTNLITPTKRPDNRDNYYKNAFSDIAGWEGEYTSSLAYKTAFIKSKIPSFVKKIIAR